MESREIDQLFRDKLESFEKDPSTLAWDKLQAQLPGKRKRLPLFWIGVAASLSLLAVSIFIYRYHAGSADDNIGPISKADELMEEVIKKSAPSESIVAELTPSVAEAPPLKEGQNPEENKAQSKQMMAQSAALKEETRDISKTAALPEDADEKVVAVINTVKEVSKEIAEAPAPVATSKQPQYTHHVREDKQNLSLTFDIGELALAATSEESAVEENEESIGDDKSVVKKIFGFASGLKNGENGFGDLRDAKNELIASVIRKKKERTERRN